ncbi:phytanoyl-CoA dioxygenase family protein [Aestuariivirga litoralis]|uniref:Phytanoyl-CoA dioxygenase family protein n=2 Tax=Aestuariivirga litoralis TaxID=2650924 RepID=A0A2W2BB21_9HYPH|nr:phytanoyl-CoA dioxygenase family protein [Aestuariivirga litoralis]PZF77328.1 phytanoyl-CoA dioxygenase family protein [Aestuariivirga litoralis]
MQLSPQDIAQFRATGYLVIRSLFAGRQLADLIRWTDDVEGWPETPGKAMKYFERSRSDGARLLQRIENVYPYHEGFQGLCDGDLRGISTQLLGGEAVLFKEKINFKLPGGAGFEPHQDAQADWGKYSAFHLTAMVSVDPCTIENGCLEMVSGHHDRGLIGDLWAPLNAEQMQGMDFVAVPTAPGDAIFFDSYAPHRSAPNVTGKPRRVLYITYNRAADGDWREQYYADKRRSFPPDCEREPGKVYEYKV